MTFSKIFAKSYEYYCFFDIVRLFSHKTSFVGRSFSALLFSHSMYAMI